MGQKVNPVGFRVGVNHAWGSRWFAPKKTFGALLVEDQKIREVCKKKLAEAGVSKILIERYMNRVRVTLFSARPGVILGRKGGDVDALRTELEKMLTTTMRDKDGNVVYESFKTKDGKDAKANDDKKKDDKKKEEAGGDKEKKDAPAEEKAPEAAPPSQAVITMNELWNRAYGCQASAIRIRHSVRKILEKGAEADSLVDQTKEVVDKLAELSRDRKSTRLNSSHS